MTYTEKRFRLCLALLICNLAFIWGNSLLPGSVSGAFSDWVKELLAAIFPGDGFSAGGGGLLRKIAHFTEFACLGGLFTWLFSMLRRPVLLAPGCGFLAACVDETIQIFVPDRGPSVFDVGIDTAGVAVGVTLLLLFHYIKHKRI